MLELLSGDEFAQEEIPERVHAALAVRDGCWIVDDVTASHNEPSIELHEPAVNRCTAGVLSFLSACSE